MNSITSLVNAQRAFFHTGQTKPISFRIDALKRLGSAIRKHEGHLTRALREDLGKSEFEAYTSEIGIVLHEIRFVLKHIRSWARPQKVKTPLTHFGSASRIYAEPYGVALLIAPWNFPFQLAVAPLIGAVAAGNCAIVKPSELTPRTSEALELVLREAFDERHVAVLQGGVDTAQALLRERMDYVFFTGSVSVGKLVMEAASRHLTPVTLELGGKSPCIVHDDASLRLAAKRIAWGKFMNAGQTCIAPDYVYVQRTVKERFLELLKDAIRELYGQSVCESGAFTRIVSERHFARLQSFLTDGDTFVGGAANRDRLLIEPTVLTGVTWEDGVMRDEIFGPILPVLEYDDITDVIGEVSRREKPLALYLFSDSKEVRQQVLDGISFGGGCVNDTVYHFTTPYLPFGGVGTSGIGAYHGKGSFDTFSHRKSVLVQTNAFDIPLRYPNLKDGLRRIKRFLK
ncbi:aldehyde dehydrogenase [Paenibacillus ginsengarvi]|uniref:Aldehyde dehydrogenase n=1 Tax=Paenibacillus ginsengarvi TaxID=400777 RepID=A0A3B0CKU0_9BACL|nr:aldehyde dehydrogenase [Paenibacillus ginsengarvi]RKN84957.1 aldehyde dehydrogenase [Paenibacillus ginsengarvi]